MKKAFMGCGTIIIIFILCLCVLIIPRSNTGNAQVVISSNYSTITYNDEIYVPIQLELMPFGARDIRFTAVNEMIKATVGGENYFLDKYFFTNYVAVKEYNGEKFIYLHTDHDVNESDYYCSLSYKKKIETE